MLTKDEFKSITIKCACGSHTLGLDYFPEEQRDTDPWMVFLSIQIVKLPFVRRLWWALKILFNKNSDYEEFIIDSEYQFKMLKRLVDEIGRDLKKQREAK